MTYQQTGQQRHSQGMTGQQTSGQQMSGQQMSQMGGGQSMEQMGTGQPMGMTRHEGLSQTHQQALLNISEAIQVCAWCADQCVQLADPMMTQCIQYCEDVQELGEAAFVLLARNSQHSIPAVTTLQQAMQACAQECAQHNHAHCQDCAQTLGQATETLAQLTGGGHGTMQSQSPMEATQHGGRGMTQ